MVANPPSASTPAQFEGGSIVLEGEKWEITMVAGKRRAGKRVPSALEQHTDGQKRAGKRTATGAGV